MKISKTYIPNQYESDVYALWERNGVFKPNKAGDPFSIVMPPPNANGNLHIGHALTISLQDIMIRYYRMSGRSTVYIPGADHAGFETWVVFEKQLEKVGKSRFDFTREELYKQVWEFVTKQRGNMELQLRALGASADWEDSVFTLDDKVVKTVYQIFKRLWDDGLIYRSNRIVNYCTKHQTGFADIEVEYQKEKGKLWQIAYPLANGSGEIIIATTRPETLLGDTAVAVNPKDQRYQKLVGQKVRLPLTDRLIPIIADDYADMTYGTGAVKITPAHDPNDFEVGKRHNLETIQVIDYDGKTINVPSEFLGLDIETARKRVLAALDAQGLLRGETNIIHDVGHCYKCGTVIEPMLKDQWFLKVAPLAKKAKEAILNDKITFTPANKGQILAQYLDNLRDWNLSRQIPWGIPIPAFQNIKDPSDWIFDTRVDQPTISINGKTYRRDEDTFDTWFSSGQWPYIVTDYLDKGNLSKFYPTSVMETGVDLLDRWIARMIMLGLYTTGKVPFKHVYLHGMVLDEKGKKMSKSKGNVINPMDVIAKYGSDALRLGIVSNRSAAQNQAFSLDKVISGRNFCNKLWNMARYIEDKIEDGFEPISTPEPKTIADHWIINQLDDSIATISKLIEHDQFAEATETVYHTIWNDVADWYLESSKGENNLPLLCWVLETCLKIAHPFAPFVTETIWQTLSWTSGLLANEKWPKSATYNDIASQEFNRLRELVVEIRNITNEFKHGNGYYTLYYQDDQLVSDNMALIQFLSRLKAIQPTDSAIGLRIPIAGRRAWLGLSVKELAEHKTNLKQKIDDTTANIKKLTDRLNNQSYIERAPKNLVNESKEQLKSDNLLLEQLNHEIDNLD